LNLYTGCNRSLRDRDKGLIGTLYYCRVTRRRCAPVRAQWRRAAPRVCGCARPPVPGCDRQSGARRGSRVRYHSPRGASGSRLADVTGNRKFVDSPLEGDGFELLVPRRKSRGFPQHSGHGGGIDGALKRYHLIVQAFFFSASHLWRGLEVNGQVHQPAMPVDGDFANRFSMCVSPFLG